MSCSGEENAILAFPENMHSQFFILCLIKSIMKRADWTFPNTEGVKEFRGGLCFACLSKNMGRCRLSGTVPKLWPASWAYGEMSRGIRLFRSHLDRVPYSELDAESYISSSFVHCPLHDRKGLGCRIRDI